MLKKQPKTVLVKEFKFLLSSTMVKRNTNFKQMFLADHSLINDVINSKSQSIYNNTNNLAYTPNQNQSCTECINSRDLKTLPFPETIKDSNGNIDTLIRDGSSSSSESSSDDENDDNHYNSNNQIMIQPSSLNTNIDTNYTPSNQRITQPQSNGENIYNSLNQRLIHPLQNFSSSSSSNESETENLDRNHNGDTPSDDFNQDNSNAYAADSSQTEMDITDNRNQQNDVSSNGEEQFTTPLPEDEFMDMTNVPNISQHRRPNNKMKRLKSKTRKKFATLQNSRNKEVAIKRNQGAYKIRKPNDDGDDRFNTPVPPEEFMDINIPVSTKGNSKEEDFDNQIKKTKRVLPSRTRRQQERKKKLKLLKLKNQRLKQLYYENKNQIMENEKPPKDASMNENDNDVSMLDDGSKNQILKNDNEQRDDRVSEYVDVDTKLNNDGQKNKTSISKTPTIRLKKFAYGTLPEQENINKPQIRVAKFADQDLIKDKGNLMNKLKYLCELCKMQFPKYSSLQQHLKENHEKKQYKIDFPDAGKYLALARKVKHKNDGNKFFYENFDSNNRDTVDITSYWCPKCQTFFQNFASMQSHMLKEHEEGTTAAKRSITRDKKQQKNKKIFYESY